MDDKLENVYVEYLKFTDKMAGEYSAMAIAGVMMAQALSIYKTALKPDEFDSMVENIVNCKDKVKTFAGPILQ
jgi:hypothetical protein